MKQLKMMIALLAVVFSVSSAFTPANKFGQSYFSYVSGDLTNPASYVHRTSDPQCTGTVLCAVFVNSDGTHPIDADLDALYSESTQFTHSGTFTHGKVEFKAN